MRIRGLAIAAVTVLSLAVSGCTDAGTEPKVTIVDPTPVVDDPQAREALKQSLSFINTTSFETYLNMGPQVDAAGYMDAPHKLAQLATVVKTADKPITVRVRLVDGATYFKIEGKPVPEVGDRWVLVDPKKVPPGVIMGFDPATSDPSGGARVLSAVTAAEKTATGFRGTVDMTKVGKGSGITLRPEQLAALNDGGTKMPFEATVDDQGRLTKLQLTLTAGEDFLPVQVRYSEFGKQSPVDKPSGADVIDAPASFYSLLGT